MPHSFLVPDHIYTHTHTHTHTHTYAHARMHNYCTALLGAFIIALNILQLAYPCIVHRFINDHTHTLPTAVLANSLHVSNVSVVSGQPLCPGASQVSLKLVCTPSMYYTRGAECLSPTPSSYSVCSYYHNSVIYSPSGQSPCSYPLTFRYVMRHSENCM